MKNPILKNLLDELLKQKKDYALFDFDNTIIIGDLGESFLHYIANNFLWKITDEFLAKFQSDKNKIKNLIQNANKQQSEKTKIDPLHPLIKYINKNNFKIGSTLKKSNPTHKKIINLILQEYLDLLKKYGPEIAYPWSAVLFSEFTLKEFIKLSNILVQSNDYKNIQKETSYSLEFEYGFSVSIEMLKLIQSLKNNNYPVRIVSASPLELVQVFFTNHPEYGIEQDEIIGMEIIKQGENKKFSSNIKQPMTYGSGKVQAFYNKFPKEKILLAAGDSITDFAMLKKAKFSLFIDKGNSEYLKTAVKNNWNIVKQKNL